MILWMMGYTIQLTVSLGVKITHNTSNAMVATCLLKHKKQSKNNKRKGKKINTHFSKT
jgi:hypothetical protein